MRVQNILIVISQSRKTLLSGDLAPKGSKAYKTSEVGDWLVVNL
jgi:3-isopropylmalate dehydrogenase